jgi:translocation and assembly module TamB
VWAALAPPGWRTRGSLDLNATLTGTVGQPDWQGTLQGRDLALRSVVEGLEFGNGRLRATLGGERMDITEFTLEGAGGPTAGGTLSATGSAQWARQTATATPAPRLSLNATAHKLRVSARADRRLTLSGNLAATLEGGMLKLRGDLNADQAQFVLPDETAPSLGTDVVVRLGSKTTDAIPPLAPLGTDVLVNVGLGNQFDVRGQGLQTRLSGKLVVSSAPESTTFQVRGEVRAASGTYRAYGQQLRIEEGVLRFSGPYDDPALDILALRGASAPSRAISGSGTDNQLVGVKITGSARNPVVKLYANPEMPDSDKLAWLVLGRPASGAGAEAAVLQQAALALLSGSSGMDATLASKLGLDDITFRGNSTLANGTTQDAAVSLGKRLSSKLYVAYEHSLSSAVGAISLYYDVSRRLTIRAQAGQDNALDLIFTVTHD